LATNPTAQYVTAGTGVYPNAARNTFRLPPTDNLDLTLMKRFSITERYRLELFGQAVNTLNHPQYIGDRLSDVANIGYIGNNVRQFLNPASSTFNRPDQVFSSNPRILTISLKLIF
jgi:hypothetical protein